MSSTSTHYGSQLSWQGYRLKGAHQTCEWLSKHLITYVFAIILWIFLRWIDIEENIQMYDLMILEYILAVPNLFLEGPQEQY